MMTTRLVGRLSRDRSDNLKDRLAGILPVRLPTADLKLSRLRPSSFEEEFQHEGKNLTMDHRCHPCESNDLSEWNPNVGVLGWSWESKHTRHTKTDSVEQLRVQELVPQQQRPWQPNSRADPEAAIP